MPTEECWRDIPGRCAYLWIYDEWLESKPRHGAVAIECGVALGKSVAYLCERLAAHGRDDIEVYAVDPLAGTHRNGEQAQMADAVGGDFALYATMMMRNAPKAFERVRVLRLSSLDAKHLFMAPDLVVLDNDHSYEHVVRELEAWRRADWIGGDDFEEEYDGVRRAVRERFGDDGFEVRTHGGPIDNPKEWQWGTWLKRGMK
jgi:hypothetical protein